MAKYAVKNRIANAARKFSKELGSPVNKSTVRSLKSLFSRRCLFTERWQRMSPFNGKIWWKFERLFEAIAIWWWHYFNLNCHICSNRNSKTPWQEPFAANWSIQNLGWIHCEWHELCTAQRALKLQEQFQVNSPNWKTIFLKEFIL